MENENGEEFFTWYKKEKNKKEEISIMENYFKSNEFKMDVSPIPLKKKKKNEKRKKNEKL